MKCKVSFCGLGSISVAQYPCMHVVPDLEVAMQNTVTENLLDAKLYNGSLGGREVTVAEDKRLESSGECC